jgi:DNA polymerase-3 subunit beta
VTDVLSYLEGASKNAPAYDAAPKQEFDTVRFKIEKSVLLALLDKVALVVPTKADNSALKSFSIEVSQDSLKIIGTDNKHTIIVGTKMFEPIASGSILLPAKILLDILRSVADDTVDIEVVNKSIIIVIGSASWELRSLEGLKFPSVPSLAQANPVKIDRYEFIAGLTAVKYAVAKDTARPGLKMVDLKANKMTACDGVRFQQAEVSAPPMRIPGGSIDLILKILGVSAAKEVIFANLPDSKMVFKVDTTLLVVTAPEVNFPHAEQLFLRPALTNDQELRVSRQSLISAIKRVRLCADEDTSAIALKLSKDAIEVSTRDQVGNKASESLAAVWKGKARTITVHHRYLLELLAVNDVEECVFKLGEDSQSRKSPILLQNQSAKMVGVVQQMLLGSLTGYKL